MTSFADSQAVKAFHREEGEKALVAAGTLLADAGLHHERHVAIGEPARTIVDYAAEKGCDQIVMSSRGLGLVADLLIGSTARKVLHLTRIPVTIVP